MPPIPHYADFRLSITQALESQLIAAFNGLAPIQLTPAVLTTVPSSAGVYRLHYPSPQVVYVGKADDDLKGRLAGHHRKLGGRANIALADVGITYITVEEDLTAIAPETVMIRWQKTQPGGSDWNGSGFGSKDPGRERDTSKPGPFDSAYPIGLGFVPTSVPAGRYTVKELLGLFRGTAGSPPALPFPLRAEKAAPDYAAATTIIAPGMSASSMMQTVAAALNATLPPNANREWQATALPGTLILYRERRRGGPFKPYTHSLQQW